MPISIGSYSASVFSRTPCSTAAAVADRRSRGGFRRISFLSSGESPISEFSRPRQLGRIFCGFALAPAATRRSATSASGERLHTASTGWRSCARSSVNTSTRPDPSNSAVYLTQDRHYRPNWKDYRLRRAVSRHLLQQAGCTRGADGIYACAGKELSLRLVTMAGRADRALAAELVQKQLREVGIEAIPTFLPANALFDPDSPVNRGEFDLAVLGFIFEPGSEATASHDLFGCGRGVASPGYCQRLVSRDLDQASRILDPGAAGARLEPRRRPTLPRTCRLSRSTRVVAVAALHATIRGFVLSPVPTQLLDAENWWLASGS